MGLWLGHGFLRPPPPSGERPPHRPPRLRSRRADGGKDEAAAKEAAALGALLLATVKSLGRGEGDSGGPWPGAAPSRELGEGLEPGGIRPYTAGDDARRIDWRVTARRGEVYLREFVAEREWPVVLALLWSPGLWGGRGGVKGIRACEIVAFLAALATAERCRMGLLLGDGSRLPGPLSLGRGNRQFLRVLETLLEETARWRPTPGLPHEPVRVLESFRRALRERSRVFLVGDMLMGREDPRGWAQEVGTLAGRHRLTVIRVGDPGEGWLPEGTRVLFWDPSQGRVGSAEGFSGGGGSQEAGGEAAGDAPDSLPHALRREAGRVREELRRRGVEVWDVDVQRPLVGQLLPRLSGGRRPGGGPRTGTADRKHPGGRP